MQHVIDGRLVLGSTRGWLPALRVGPRAHGSRCQAAPTAKFRSRRDGLERVLSVVCVLSSLVFRTAGVCQPIVECRFVHKRIPQRAPRRIALCLELPVTYWIWVGATVARGP